MKKFGRLLTAMVTPFTDDGKVDYLDRIFASRPPGQAMRETAQHPRRNVFQELGFDVLVPSFVISELRTAFQMGFVIYVPFLIIDMVVASVLMSMGMLMLPPILISLPFKILLFVLVDGWYLVVRSLAGSFQV